MKTIINLTILAVVLVGLSTTPVMPKARAASDAATRCSNSTLRGSYSLHATGTTPFGTPFAAVGVFNFDGAGHLTGTLYQRVPSGNTIAPLTGPYSVSENCTVTDTWNFSDGSSSQHLSVIVDGGRGYFILNTTEGVTNVISGEARQQFPGHDEDR